MPALHLLVAVHALVLGGCQINSGRPVESLAPSRAWLAPMQTRAGVELEQRFGGLIRSPLVQNRLDRIGRNLLAQMPACPQRCSFGLLRSEQINALSLAEGHVYVTAGLYRRLNSEDLLAAALAHELAHVAAGHGFRPVRGAGARLSREIQADLMAVDCLQKAGYDPFRLVELQQIISHVQDAGWSSRRIAAIRERLSAQPPVFAR
jgi:predicted Zn-dependent protease